MLTGENVPAAPPDGAWPMTWRAEGKVWVIPVSMLFSLPAATRTANLLWPDGSGSCAVSLDRGGDRLHVRGRQGQSCRIDPAIDLHRLAGTYDRSRHTRPCQCPCHGNGRRGRPMLFSDLAHRFGHGEVAFQCLALEISIA